MRPQLPAEHASIQAKESWRYKKKFVAAVLLFVCITVSIPITVIVTAPDNVILPPGNDQCVQAFRLKVDGPRMQGTFEGATPDYGGAFCGAVAPRGDDDDDDDPEHNHRRVIWYKFRGTGNAVRVWISNKDVSLTIYHGDCNALFGVKTNVTFGNATAAALDWIECNSPNAPVPTFKNQMYYIYAAENKCLDCSSDQKFTIGIETVTTSPINNLCETALELLPTAAVNGTIQDTMWSSVLSEHDYFGSGSFGVWYVVHGNGQFLKLTLQDYIDNVRLRIQLLMGTCESLALITSEASGILPINSNTSLAAYLAECSQEQECVYTPTEAGEIYLVYVYTKDVYMYTLPEDEHNQSGLSFEISAQFL